MKKVIATTAILGAGLLATTFLGNEAVVNQLDRLPTFEGKEIIDSVEYDHQDDVSLQSTRARAFAFKGSRATFTKDTVEITDRGFTEKIGENTFKLKAFSAPAFYKDRDGSWYEVEYGTTTLQKFERDFRVSWLRKITKTVYADTIFVGAGDGVVAYRDAASWNTAHDATTGTTAQPTSTFISISSVENPFLSNRWSDNRGFFPIDTSSIPAGATISAASLFVNVCSGCVYDTSGDPEDYLVVVETFQPSNSTFTTADYDLVGDAIDAPTEGSNHVAFTSITTDTYVEWTLDATGRSWVKRSGETSSCGASTGWTCLGIRTGLSVEDVAPTTNENAGVDARSSETTGTSQDPYFEVTYVVPSPFVQPPQIIQFD